jgi:hypothetical protein
MRPEASRLVYRIKTALKGESNGLDTANLAWQYAAEVEYAENLLKQYSEKQDDLEAYVAAYSSPSALDTLDTLDFADLERWNERCEKLGWRIAPAIDHARIKELRDRLAAIEDPKSWLLGEFRKQSRAKKPLEALRIANVILDRFGADENIEAESKRLDEQVAGIAEGELKNAIQDLMPSKSAESILARYEEVGIALPDKDGPIRQAKEAKVTRHLEEAGEAIDALVKQSDLAESDEERAQLESDYFERDYLLSTTDTRPKLSTKQREDFANVSTLLSRYRGTAESNILIRSAIKDLRDAIQGISISFGNKKAPAHDAYERLASLQMQAKRIGHRIPNDLREDIRRALSQAKRKRAPKYAIIGGGLLALVAAVFWVVNGQVESTRQATTWQEATAAINQATARQNIPQAKQALDKWQSAISEAPAGHALVNAATSLQEWIAEQSRLQNAYSEIADKLDSIRTENAANPTSDDIRGLLESATTIRASLTAQSTGDNAQKIKRFQSWQVMRLKQQESTRKRALMDQMSSAQDQLEQATAATDTETFEARSKDLIEAITNARALIAKYPELDQNALQQRSLQRIETALTGFHKKRASMETAQRTIQDARDLSSYLKSLEAIYNFDTLSSESKRDIGRILKLEGEYKSLLQYLIMPDDKTGWIELGSSNDYANAKPAPDKAEQAYLERLIGNMLFPAIYESKVKYFEGAPVAKSEYSVFLVDPIQKGDTAGLKTGINFSFKVRGFDESGEPETEIREMNFLSHPDGSFWGFFYDPSALSKESLYFQKTIRPALMQIRAAAPRFTAIELIKDLSDERSLSPAFRAYWQQKLIAFIEMNPWKWGLPLSPSLVDQTRAIEKLTPDGIDERLWLSAVEQTSPSIDLIEYFRLAGKQPILQEAKAFSVLYAFAMQGEMALVGQADASGKIEYNESKDADDRLWVVNGLTGRIEALENNISIAPYSPIMAYRFEDQPAERLIQKTRMQSGIDLSAETYKGRLPSILK